MSSVRQRRPRRTGMSRDEEIALFWALVDRSGGDAACWPVTKLKPMWNGYYSTRFETDKKRTCHRIAFEIANGPIDETDGRMVVLHDCPGGENRACANPAHLKLGTYSDNTRDMYNKGRDLWRSGKAWRRLSVEEVDAIRAECASGDKQIAIAERHSVSPQIVSAIHRGVHHSKPVAA